MTFNSVLYSPSKKTLIDTCSFCMLHSIAPGSFLKEKILRKRHQKPVFLLGSFDWMFFTSRNLPSKIRMTITILLVSKLIKSVEMRQYCHGSLKLSLFAEVNTVYLMCILFSICAFYICEGTLMNGCISNQYNTKM